MQDFDKDREDVLNRAVEGGLTHIITVGIDLDSSHKALELAEKYGFIYSTVGYHPHNARECSPRYLDELASMIPDPKIVAWGEIGLDFYRNRSPHEKQHEAFSNQLNIADDLDLPVIIHDREAHDETLKALQKMGKGERKGVIHCFSGDVELAAAFIDLGYYISIPGTVTYKNAERVKKVASSIPLEYILIETDAPFLAPVPKRGKRNEPFFVTFTAQEIARLRDIDIEEVDRQTTKNTKDLFGLT
ncbi:MAG: TatD family hydrolase [Desulfobacterales bacterium]|nr:TatD family hydrolase [Desulfobacterales bacterium]